MNASLYNILNSFESIQLKDLERVSLLKRTDLKFLVHVDKLGCILNAIMSNYKLLEIDDKRLMTYNTLYFDTNNDTFYKDHHNGRVHRLKIRIRNYLDTNQFFLEVKQKNGKGKTIKKRIKISEFEHNLSEKANKFIEKVTKRRFELKPKIWNNFNRITLVNNSGKERLTFDLNLNFKLNNNELFYKNLVIIEVKQERINRNSPIIKVLKSYAIYPYNLSKYCIGVSQLRNDLKSNNFKQKHLKINKITG